MIFLTASGAAAGAMARPFAPTVARSRPARGRAGAVGAGAGAAGVADERAQRVDVVGVDDAVDRVRGARSRTP